MFRIVICYLILLIVTSALADCGKNRKDRKIRSYWIQPNCTVKCSMHCELDGFHFELELPYPGQTSEIISPLHPSSTRNGSLDIGTTTPTPCPTPIFRDCHDALNNSYTQSGVYTIQPDSLPPFDVYCDMDTDGGGWTVFQRRQDGSVDFYRNWVNYTNGFGNLSNEFWLGLEYIHRLTNGHNSQLRVDLEDWSGNKRYAQYSTFQLRGASTNYRLEVSGYAGNAGNSLAHHNNRPFSTYDRDNDAHAINCAMTFDGAWWYGNCHDSNLNGKYFRGRYSSYANGVVWQTFKGDSYSLKFTEIKFRATR